MTKSKEQIEKEEADEKVRQSIQESEDKERAEREEKERGNKPSASKKKEEKEEKPGKSGENLTGHTVPDNHLADKQKTAGQKPGADMESEGIAHATSVVGGAAGQAVGLPTPLPPKEAKEAGFAK